MPYEIKPRLTKKGKFVVIKKSTGEVMGHTMTREKAQKMIIAMHINEKK